MVDPMGFGNVVGEYDESGTLLSRYTHGLGLISKDDNFYTFDGNGNTSEMTNAANEIINFYGYEPFGNNLFEAESVENDFEFVGQLGVREMGEDLIYMRNRFYSPTLGRFMAEDPIGLAGGDVSFYRYVENDPVNWVDPTGLHSSPIPGGSPCVGSCHATETGQTGTIEMTSGQKQAAVSMTGGTAAVGVGLLTGNAPMAIAGSSLATEGAVLMAIESGFGGDTSEFPMPWDIMGDLGEGIYDYFFDDEKCP